MTRKTARTRVRPLAPVAQDSLGAVRGGMTKAELIEAIHKSKKPPADLSKA